MQMVLDGKEAHQVPQLQFREDGTFMGAQHVKLPVEYDPLEASLHAMTGVIKELSESYHVKKKKKKNRKTQVKDFRGILHARALLESQKNIFYQIFFWGSLINLSR